MIMQHGFQIFDAHYEEYLEEDYLTEKDIDADDQVSPCGTYRLL